MEGLEPLVINAIYEAEATGRVSRSHNDPEVMIFNPRSAGDYRGIVARSTSLNLEERARSNRIRSRLKEEGVGAGKVNVLVMRAYKRAGPEGPYIVRATERETHKMPSFYLAPGEALRSVRGPNIYIGMITNKEQGGMSIVTYEADISKVNGLLVSSGLGTDDQKFEMNMVLQEMVTSLYLGDRVLVRKLMLDGPHTYFEPILEFYAADQATFAGQSLVTSVSGSSIGDKIFNLPILYRMQLGITRKSMVGVGYVKMEGQGPKSYLHERVFVSGADRDVGGYASQIRIDEITQKGIMGKMLRR